MSRGGSKGILYGPRKSDALSPCPQTTCVAEGIADDVKASGIPQFVSAQDVVGTAMTVSDADVVKTSGSPQFVSAQDVVACAANEVTVSAADVV
jgi:hypothetical protein